MPNMNLNSHASSIGMLVALNMTFLGALFVSYHFGYPVEFRTLLAGAFTGYNGALLLALRGAGGDDDQGPPKPPGV